MKIEVFVHHQVRQTQKTVAIKHKTDYLQIHIFYSPLLLLSIHFVKNIHFFQGFSCTQAW